MVALRSRTGEETLRSVEYCRNNLLNNNASNMDEDEEEESNDSDDDIHDIDIN